MTTSDSEWQRVVRVTTKDNELQRITMSVQCTTSVQQVTNVQQVTRVAQQMTSDTGWLLWLISLYF